MKQKGKRNWRVWRRVVAWLLTLVMILGLTNGLTLPAQAASDDTFEVTLNPTTGALETVKYTLGSSVSVTGTVTMKLILWDADDKSQGVLVSESLNNPTADSTIVLQCGNNTEFGKRYRIAGYTIYTGVDPLPTVPVPDDWPEIGVTEVVAAENFFDDRSVTLKIGAEQYTYTGYIGDALKPHSFEYDASGVTKFFDGQPASISVMEKNFPFNSSISNATLKILYRKPGEEEFTEENPTFKDAGVYEVEFKLSFPGLGYETVTDSRTVRINPYPASISFEQPVRTFTLPLTDEQKVFDCAVTQTDPPESPEGATDPQAVKDPVTYSSSNPEVAEVDSETGQVTIKAAGTAEITATVQLSGNYEYDSLTATCYVIVNKTDAAFYFEDSLIEAYLDETTVPANQLMRVANGGSQVDPATDHNTIIFTSSDDSVARVDSLTGEVHLVGQGREGTVTITADVTDGPDYNYQPGTASYILIVSKQPYRAALLETGPVQGHPDETYPTVINYKNKNGETVTPEGRLLPGDGAVSFSSSDPSVAAVNRDTGEVTFVSAGTAVITAAFTDGYTAKYTPRALSYDVEVTKKETEVRFVQLNPGAFSPAGPVGFIVPADLEAVILDTDVPQGVNPVLYRPAGETDWKVAKPEDGIEIEYSSSNEAVAAVDQTGKITLTGAGTTVITAALKENRVYSFTPNEISYTLTVNPYELRIAYDPNSTTKHLVDCLENPTFTPNLVYTNYDGSQPVTTTAPEGTVVTYASSNEDVAAVDENGVVTIKALGVAVITATVEDEGFYHYEPNVATFELTVDKKTCAIYYNDDQKEITVFRDETVSNPLRYLYKPDVYTDQPGDGTFAYTSSKESVATVDPTTGDVTITGVGTTTIAVTVEDGDYYTYDPKEASYTLTVIKHSAKITFDGTDAASGSITKKYGDASFAYTAKKVASNADDANDGGNGTITYRSTEPSVATVNAATGEVTIVGVGTTTIVASIADTETFTYADGRTASYDLTVERASLEEAVDYTAPTAKTNLVYNGSAQELVNKGTINSGKNHKFYYVLGEQAAAPESGWSTAVPKASNAGKYYVWWKIDAESNYKDVAASGPIAVTIAQKDVTGDSNVKLVLTNAGPFTYDGTAKGAEYTVKDGTKLLAAGRDYAVSSVKYNVWDETNERWSEDPVDSAIDAGKYQLVVTLTEDSGNYKGKLVSAEFEIRKAAPSADPTPSAAKNLVYNGGEQVLVARINDPEAATPAYPAAVGGTIKYALTETSRKPADFTDVKDDAADVKGQDAKTYYVWWWIEGDANHSTTDPKCLTVKIAKQGELTVQLDPSEVDYTGAAIQNPGTPKFYLNGTEVTLAESTADQTNDYKVSYQKKTSSWRTVSEVKDAGEYKIIFALEGNYTGTLNAAFKVNQAVSAVSAPEADNRTYDGTSKALLRAPATVTTVNDSGTVQYAVGSDYAAAPTTGWSESIPQRTNAGTYYVWYRSSGDANYKASEPACVAVTIDPKNAADDDSVTVTVSPDEFTYNGRAQVPANVTVMDGGKTLGSGSYGISYMSGNEAAAADSIKDVGTYKVVVTFTGNYEGTKEAEFTIKPVSAAVVLPPTAIEDLVYDGTAKALATAGSCLNGTMKYAATTDEAEPTSWSEDLPRKTNAGRYYVWYKASGDANYTDSAAAYIIVEIAPKNAIGNGNITAAAVPDSFEYSGNPRTPSVSVMDGTDTVDPAYYDISWQKIDGSMWVNVNKDEIVAVATYKAAVTFKGNYSGSRDALFTITKATPVLSQEPTPANPTYNGEPQALLTSIGATNDGRLYVAVSDSSETAPVTGWSETSPKATEAGTYYIWYRIVGDDNHKDLAAACWKPVKIGKAAGNITVTADRIRFAYDGTAKSPNVKVVLTKDGKKTELAETEYSVAYFAKQAEGDEYKPVGKAAVTEIGKYKLVVTAKNYGVDYEVGFEITGEPIIVGHTLVLSGSIGVNFYVDLPAGDGFACESMTFEVNGETREALFDSSARSSEGYYRFTCHVNSIQMADEIKPTLHYVHNGEIKTLKGDPYSVLEYVRESQGMDFDDKTVALIHALADYGYYVQRYLPAGAIHTAMMERPFHSITNADTARALAAVGSQEITMLRSIKIDNVSLSLILDSDTAIRLYFTPAAGYDGEASATVDGQTIFYDTDDSGRFIVEIPDIAANRLARNFDVRLTTENVTTTMKLSVLSYVKLVLENSENEAERNAMTALYDYYAAAAAYKA